MNDVREQKAWLPPMEQVKFYNCVSTPTRKELSLLAIGELEKCIEQTTDQEYKEAM